MSVGPDSFRFHRFAVMEGLQRPQSQMTGQYSPFVSKQESTPFSLKRSRSTIAHIVIGEKNKLKAERSLKVEDITPKECTFITQQHGTASSADVPHFQARKNYRLFGEALKPDVSSSAKKMLQKTQLRDGDEGF